MAIWIQNSDTFIEAEFSSRLDYGTRIAFWFCTTETRRGILNLRRSSTIERAFHAVAVDGAGKVTLTRSRPLFTGGTSQQTIQTSGSITRNQWHHIIVELIANNSRHLRLDGDDLASDLSTDANPPGALLRVGNGIDANTADPGYPDFIQNDGKYQDWEAGYMGYVADLAVWTGVNVLFATEANRMYKMGVPHYLYDPVNLVAYCPFSRGVNFEIAPSSWSISPTTRQHQAAYLEFTGFPADSDTVTISGQTYTFKTTIGTAFDVARGTTALGAAANLARAIELRGTAGTDYHSSTTKHPTCCAYSSWRGDQLNPIVYVRDIAVDDTTSRSISKSSSNISGPFDMDGNSVSALTRVPSSFYSKRRDFWWEDAGTFPADVGKGANNHGHDPPTVELPIQWRSWHDNPAATDRVVSIGGAFDRSSRVAYAG